MPVPPGTARPLTQKRRSSGTSTATPRVEIEFVPV